MAGSERRAQTLACTLEPAGISNSTYGRDYRFGYGLGVLEQGSVNFELAAEAQRRESPTAGDVSNGFLGRATFGW